jgi:cell wall assembly regulator SMI1
METKEKLKTAAIAMASDFKTQITGEAGEQPTPTIANLEMVEAIINDWPAMSKKSATLTMDKYGPPNEAIPSRLIWYNNGPWKRTIVYRDEIPHDFPQPHTDVIEQFIDYRVPPEMFSELAKFDGSVIAERTKGEVSSRCDMEAANIIALNLMNDIVTGKLNAEQARQMYGDIISAYMMNRPAPYAEKLQFIVPPGNTIDTDEVMIGDAMVHQAMEKVQDLMGRDASRQDGLH